MMLTLLPDSVLFIYVDNSNVWIEGQRLQAVKLGLARDALEAQRRGLSASWTYDFGRLYELACPADARIGRSILFGSRPPVDDSLWNRARRDGFEVRVFDRNAANKEKQVDVSLSTTMMEDSYEYMQRERKDVAVLVAGDRDFLPTINSIQKRGFDVRVVFWEHGISKELRDTANEFVSLDEHFEYLGR